MVAVYYKGIHYTGYFWVYKFQISSNQMVSSVKWVSTSLGYYTELLLLSLGFNSPTYPLTESDIFFLMKQLFYPPC